MGRQRSRSRLGVVGRDHLEARDGHVPRGEALAVLRAHAGGGAVVYRCKLKMKAKFESVPSYCSFKR